MNYRNESLRTTARSMPCMIQSEHCNRDPQTTVWVHSDEDAHGKAKGLKAHDAAGAWGCAACHETLPRLPAAQRIATMRAAIIRTHLELWGRGLVEVAGSRPREKAPAPIPKILPREVPAWRR